MASSIPRQVTGSPLAHAARTSVAAAVAAKGVLATSQAGTPDASPAGDAFASGSGAAPAKSTSQAKPTGSRPSRTTGPLGRNHVLINGEGEYFALHPSDEGVRMLAARLVERGSTDLANSQGRTTRLPLVADVLVWARAKELGVDGLSVSDFKKVAAGLDVSPESLQAMRRLAAAYGVNAHALSFNGQPLDEVTVPPRTGELETFSAVKVPAHGFPLIAAPAVPLGTVEWKTANASELDLTTLSDEGVEGAVRWLKFQTDGDKELKSLSNHPDPLPIVFFARARELGLQDLEVDFRDVALRLAPTEANAEQLLRLARAYEVDPATITFGGKKLSTFTTVRPHFWNDFAAQSDAVDKVLVDINSLEGLDEFKAYAQGLRRTVETNRIRASLGLPVVDPQLNVQFVGPPGTGKTTAVRLLGRLLFALGVTKSDGVSEVGRQDLVGEYIGLSEKKTTEAFKKAKGGILFIDEAYSLVSKDAEGKDFGKKVIDTLVQLMTSPEGRDTVVVLAGYPIQMKDLMKMNPGLESRVGRQIDFASFRDEVLAKILTNRIRAAGYVAKTDDVDKAARELGRDRVLPDFANARAVINLFNRAIQRQSDRVVSQLSQGLIALDRKVLQTLTREDLLGDRDPIKTREMGLQVRSELDGLEGLSEVKQILQDVHSQVVINALREQHHLPTHPPLLNASFEGRPGTGKTTVARLYAKDLYAEGVLSKPDVSEVGAKDLISGMDGGSATNVKEAFQRARGGLLFIDEAYALANGSKGGQEAIDALVQLMTSPEGEGTVVVLSGYPELMKKLYASNPGLRSRLGRILPFDNYAVPQLAHILVRNAKSEGYVLSDELARQVALKVFADSDAPDYANARSALNALQEAILRQAGRLVKRMERRQKDLPTSELEQLTAADFGL
jgi:SpoVK/Ycf46/Vps4 family AAA+-type ATPase